MKALLLVAVVAVVIAIAFMLYGSHVSGNRLQVDPHTREEIEKAKRR